VSAGTYGREPGDNKLIATERACVPERALVCLVESLRGTGLIANDETGGLTQHYGVVTCPDEA